MEKTEKFHMRKYFEKTGTHKSHIMNSYLVIVSG